MSDDEDDWQSVYRENLELSRVGKESSLPACEKSSTKNGMTENKSYMNVHCGAKIVVRSLTIKCSEYFSSNTLRAP